MAESQSQKQKQQTEYVVLEKKGQSWAEVESERSDGLWVAGSAVQAIKDAAGDQPSGEYHAVPARSWESSHVRLRSKQETVTRVTIDKVGADGKVEETAEETDEEPVEADANGGGQAPEAVDPEVASGV